MDGRVCCRISAATLGRNCPSSHAGSSYTFLSRAEPQTLACAVGVSPDSYRQRRNEGWSRNDLEGLFWAEQTRRPWTDPLLALERQRGIPASFCPSSLSPRRNPHSGILSAFLYGLVCLACSFPFTVCNIHTELISSSPPAPPPTHPRPPLRLLRSFIPPSVSNLAECCHLSACGLM